MPFGLGFFATAGAGAGAAGSFDLLESQILGSNQTSITFSNLNSTYGTTYQHLQFRIVTRTLRSGTDDALQITFNSSGNTGASHQLWGNGSSVSSQAPTNEVQQIASYSLTAANSAANSFGAVVVDILDPFETTKNKTMRALAGKVGDTSVVSLSSLAWYSTAAITTIKFDSRNGNFGFAANSRFSLYGWKAA
jgi:hypothetical protein